MTDWYSMVPKELSANLLFRKNLLKKAAGSKSLQKELRKACSEDILFYLNFAAWTYNPKLIVLGLNPIVPFITYGFQDEALLEILRCVREGVDIGIDKSREMGASWMDLNAIEWFWHFSPQLLSFLMVSRKESYVDEKGNPKSLFWKIDFLHKHQPKWLLPKGRSLGWNDPNRRLMHMENAETGSVIDGESTTGNVARGDRRTAILLDEFSAFDVNDSFAVLSATRDATSCRIFNATPHGGGNAFYSVMHDMDAVFRLHLHWSTHPDKNKGLYRRGEDGKVELLDKCRGYVFVREKGVRDAKKVMYPDEYPFILEKMPGDWRVRSPWYDNERNRCASDQEIAEQLDIDYLGSDYQFFDSVTINKLIENHCISPERVGDLEYNPDTSDPKRFSDGSKGRLKLWIALDADDGIARDRKFCLGADISAGTGASNSTAAVYDRFNGEKVAEYANPNILPKDFARFCMALGTFFNKARITPDRSGPTGEVFTKTLITEGYGNIYYRRNEKKVSRDISTEPGVWLNPAQRTSVLEEYRDALGTFKLINRSSVAMKECLQFIRKMDGTIEHSASVNAQDPSGARTAHGDIVIADALAWLDMSDSVPQPDQTEPDIPENCIASRMKKCEDARAKARKDTLGEQW